MPLKASLVAGLLVFGSLNTILLKVLVTGSYGAAERFEKPWCLTLDMFVAMSLSLLFDKDMRRRCCRKPAQEDTEEADLIDEGIASGIQQGREHPFFAKVLQGDGEGSVCASVASGGESDSGYGETFTWRQKVTMTSGAAVFDVLASGLGTTGLLFVPASVYLLLRGAEVFFTEVFSVLFLGRDSFCYRWLGVASCSFGVVLVGLASVGAARSEGGGGDRGGGAETLLPGMFLVLAGQAMQAAQWTAEEHLLKRCDLPQLQILGFEGLWGGMITLTLLFAFYYMPGEDHGRLEDTRHAVSLMRENFRLVACLLVQIFSVFAYNIFGIAVTGALSAVHRVMISAMRTAVVWGFGLAVHGVIPGSRLGEAWTDYSPLAVAGFLLVVLGNTVYGAMLRVPGLEYPPGT